MLLASTLALAVDLPHTAVLTNPHGPVIALGASALGFPSGDGNLRVHHMFDRRWGLTVTADATRAEILFVPTTHVGLRVGPRISFRGRALRDWAAHPFVLAGFTDLSSQGGRLASSVVLGAGGEVHRTWVWGRVGFELGIGMYGLATAAYLPAVESFEGSRGKNPFPLRPILNGSVGYAF